MSNRTLHPDATVIDGSALLWTINWPSEGTVNDFVTNVNNRVKKYLEKTDVYPVFDRYYDFSTKSVARGGRETGVTRTHQLRIETKLPAQNVVLFGVENKKQLICIIFGELIRDRLLHVECTKSHKLAVTGEQPCPVEISSEQVKPRHDLETHHEDIIVQRVLKCGGKSSDRDLR